jgi:hypothetical protein
MQRFTRGSSLIILKELAVCFPLLKDTQQRKAISIEIYFWIYVASPPFYKDILCNYDPRRVYSQVNYLRYPQ